jgi:hypothetical protein
MVAYARAEAKYRNLGGGGGGSGSDLASVAAAAEATRKEAEAAAMEVMQLLQRKRKRHEGGRTQEMEQDSMLGPEGEPSTPPLTESAEAADVISPRDADANVLRAWRARCPQLRALWAEAARVTAWQGVTFGEAGGSDAGRVVRINLMCQGLTGDLPAELGRLTALTSLHLHGNMLTSVPAALGGLTALKSLDLSGNQLTSVPAVLGGLTALKSLDLQANKLTNAPVEWEKGGALEMSGCAIIW